MRKYTFADVLKTLYGIQQRSEPLRRAAYLIHCSLIDKKNRIEIEEFMPLPFDEDKTHIDIEKHRQYLLLKATLKQQVNGGRATTN